MSKNYHDDIEGFLCLRFPTLRCCWNIVWDGCLGWVEIANRGKDLREFVNKWLPRVC